MLDKPFGEEYFTNIQSKLPLAQQLYNCVGKYSHIFLIIFL